VASRIVECLNCGSTRHISPLPSRPGAVHECARCGYVGWADTASLNEVLRRALRERTPDQRRHIAAW
jgi:Zn ribbon nucleic-acid-binding protein